jgi:hypothetical protein
MTTATLNSRRRALRGRAVNGNAAASAAPVLPFRHSAHLGSHVICRWRRDARGHLVCWWLPDLAHGPPRS